MNLDEKIKKIRKDNKMSQDDIAEVLNVTRQTISNWENGKNYPDIETLIKISDEFNISLDILLKENMNMVKEIDKNAKNTKKYKVILKVIISILIILICSFCIYLVIYSNTKNKLESHFNEGIKVNNFIKNKEGYYVLKDNGITFSVPNQKMPKLLEFDLHFYLSNLDCDIALDNDQVISITWLDWDYLHVTLYNEKNDII